MKENRRRRYNAERHLVIPIFENLASTDAVSTVNSRTNGRLNFGRLIFHNYSSAGFQNFIRNLTREDDDEDEDLNRENNAPGNGDVSRSNTSGSEQPVSDGEGQSDGAPSSTQQSDEGEDELMSGTETRATKKKQTSSHNASFERNRKNVTANCSDNSKLSSPRRDVDDTLASTSRSLSHLGESSSWSAGSTSEEDATPSKKSPKKTTTEQPEVKQSTIRSATKSDDEEDDDDDEDYCGSSQPKKIPKREKLDSGISEESDEGKVSASNESSFSDMTFSEAMDVESDDSDFSDYSSSETRLSDLDFNDSKFDSDESKISVKYRMALEKRIQALPLPNPIKTYINYDREFRFPC